METEVHEIRQITVSRSGPIPDPSELHDYEAACPGAADRIISMAELEQSQRHKMEAQALRQPYNVARVGQGCGVAALLVMASLAGYLAYLGYPGLAAVIAALDFVGVVAIFVTGHRDARRASDEDSDEVQEIIDDLIDEAQS